ncbi:MAG: hypothetical protein EP348_05880 [Alphaproteobacteria bacterium]|nr:MAG: hypothetical protein EP348_05880 [Alphaproteobacteria bacterium]
MPINAITHDPYAYLERDLPNAPVARYESAPADTQGKGDSESFGKDGFGFNDFLDIINPLQHIPGVASVYREITGDEISPGARMIGDTIYGGGIGFVAGLLNSAVEQATGKDIGGNVIALFGGDDAGKDIGAPTEKVLVASRGLSNKSGEDGGAEASYYAAPAAVTPAAATLIAENPAPSAPRKAADTDATKEVPAVKAAPVSEGQMTTAPLKAPAHEQAAPAIQQPTKEITAEAPHLAPIGLKWRGQRPNLVRDIEKARQLQTPNLTEAQMEAVLKSFRLAPGGAGTAAGGSHAAGHITPPTVSTPQLTAAEATAKYQKTSGFAAHPERQQQLFPARPGFKP